MASSIRKNLLSIIDRYDTPLGLALGLVGIAVIGGLFWGASFVGKKFEEQFQTQREIARYARQASTYDLINNPTYQNALSEFGDKNKDRVISPSEHKSFAKEFFRKYGIQSVRMTDGTEKIYKGNGLELTIGEMQSIADSYIREHRN